MPFERINIEQARALIAERDATVIDIRDPHSYQSGHIENAQHVTDQNVEEFIAEADHRKPLIVCCYHGNSSQPAADFFSSKGFTETYSLDGGYAAWAVEVDT